VLSEEPNVLRIQGLVVAVGTIMGQAIDLLQILASSTRVSFVLLRYVTRQLRLGLADAPLTRTHARTHARTDGEPPDTKYLFLGDYSGRGDHEVIAVCLVLALKVSSACG
jgi:hypothetical protein